MLIKIPTDKNPYIVTVNGRTYTYSAGAEVDVPAEVAAVIVNARSLDSRPAPEPGKPGQVWTRTENGKEWRYPEKTEAGFGLEKSPSGVLTLSGAFPVLTDAPTSARLGGGYQLVILSAEPDTKYDGYIYVILSAD